MNVIVDLLDDDDDDDNEFALIYLLSKENFIHSSRIYIENYSTEHFYSFFRFDKPEFINLTQFIFRNSNKPIYLGNGSKLYPDESMMILLRRFSYPNRLCELQHFFHKSTTTLSRCVKQMVQFLITSFINTNHLGNYNIQLQQLSSLIQRNGCPLSNIFAFIDGTMIEICRPSNNQRPFYSGHYREHGLKFQSIILPNGMIFIFGPWPGSRHDLFLLRDSRIREQLYDTGRFRANNTNYYIYADSGYYENEFILTGFKSTELSNNPQERARQVTFNTVMSKYRIIVEWGFGKIVNLFAFLDFKKNLKPIASSRRLLFCWCFSDQLPYILL